MVRFNGEKATIPTGRDVEELGFRPIRKHYLGTYKGQGCYAVEVDKSLVIPDGFVTQDIWAMFNHVEQGLFNILLRAFHVIEWDSTDQFCCACGAKTTPKSNERAKECPSCGRVSYPRISPAVIILVHQDTRVLLARSYRFKDDIYSVLAGFVDPGETLEDTIRREIQEEAGIEVKNIRYFASQPWPFPDSLMIAFTAQYANGSIKVDTSENMDIQWFEYDNLPTIPGKISIARHLIDRFIKKQNKLKKKET